MNLLALLWRGLRQSCALMVGIPDYDRYVAHLLQNHPGEPAMTYPEFFRERQARRYSAKDGQSARCC